MVKLEEEAGPDGFDRAVQNMVETFYASNGLLAPKWADRMQQAFSALMALFCMVGLFINVRNTVRMICHTCFSIWAHSSEEYNQRMT